MTVLNFPASPTVGQEYIANEITYTWTSGGYWEANSSGSSAFVKIAGDTMTGNLNVPSINEIDYITAAEKAAAKDGDAVVYDQPNNALVLRSKTQSSKIVSASHGGGGPSDANWVTDLVNDNAGFFGDTDIAGTSGWSQVQVAMHGTFQGGGTLATFLFGLYLFRVDSNGTELIIAKDYVLWSGTTSDGQQTASVQGFYNLDPQYEYRIKMKWVKDSATGTATPVLNSSLRAIFTV